MLRRLVLASGSGLCNRLRAIASARRLCARVGARCHIVWNWGQFHRFFAPLPDATLCPWGVGAASWLLERFGQRCKDQRIDMSRRSAWVFTGQIIYGHDEPPVSLAALRDWLPRPSDRVARRADEFAGQHFGNVVGMHIRRTDHGPAKTKSPDELFLETAARLLDEGKRIFLATDNVETEQLLRRFCGERLITFPKAHPLVARWPRSSFDPQACEDDLLDLLLLARTEYVVGSFFSSFSNTAMVLNGSPKCRTLNIDEPRLIAA
ncbi:MAG: hypothetical protein SFU86_23145 [Pirellulaceae bacterium]|nr:hypothetical protein [Pirellulaceae bacterium]